jgi:hypothetical protein
MCVCARACLSLSNCVCRRNHYNEASWPDFGCCTTEKKKTNLRSESWKSAWARNSQHRILEDSYLHRYRRQSLKPRNTIIPLIWSSYLRICVPKTQSHSPVTRSPNKSKWRHIRNRKHCFAFWLWETNAAPRTPYQHGLHSVTCCPRLPSHTSWKPKLKRNSITGLGFSHTTSITNFDVL